MRAEIFAEFGIISLMVGASDSSNSFLNLEVSSGACENVDSVFATVQTRGSDSQRAQNDGASLHRFPRCRVSSRML